MKTHNQTPIRIAKIGYIFMSAALCAIGIVFIVMSRSNAFVIDIVFGIALIVFGIIKIVGYFSKDLFRLAFQYDLEFGIALIVIGSVILARRGSMVTFICIALGLALLTDGMFKIRIAVESKRFGIRFWQLIAVLAVLTGAVGLVLMFRPTESGEILSTFIGIALLCDGVLNLDVALSTVKIAKNQMPDDIEAEFRESEE